jgi:glycosyltransferase involved in cell wall biosynthesis
MRLTAISQFVTGTHGQGKINLELLRQLHSKGMELDIICSSIDDAFSKQSGVTWQKVPCSLRLPTNWLRCEVFRIGAQRRIEGKASINNGAAAIVPSRVNIAMFVHSAWLVSPFRNRWWKGIQPLVETGFTEHQAILERRAFSQADTVVALSEQVRMELLEFAKIPESKVVVVHPGVDCERFCPLEGDDVNCLRQHCGMSKTDDRLLLLFVGEIRSNRKNLDLVLKALTRDPSLVLAVIGAAHRSPYLAMVRQLGIANRVHFLGQRRDVAELMRGADCFIFPTHYEPFGLVITEAMASGLPVITTQQAGAACVITDGHDGLIVPNGNEVDYLLNAVTTLKDSDERKKLGIAARLTAERLTWKEMASHYENLLS